MDTLPPIYTAPLFAPLHDRLISLLQRLEPRDWTRPTVAGSWQVRDVVAHLLEVDLRRLTVGRDAQSIDPGRPIDGYADLVAFLNDLNAQWVAMARRFSPRVLIELLQVSGPAIARMVAALPPHDPAAFAVAWAGELRSENWFDIGRDYTERWHHQMQIRTAVGAPGLLQPRWLLPLLDLSVRSLPVAYAGVQAGDEASVVPRVGLDDRAESGAEAEPDRPAGGDHGGDEIDGVIDGASGDAAWTVRQRRAATAQDGPSSGRWHLQRGARPAATTTVRVDADTAWRLFYNALPADEVRRRAVIGGNERLGEPLLRARSVMV